MFSIRFFDLRYNPSNIAKRGEVVEVNQLILNAQRLYKDLFESSDHIISDCAEISKINPITFESQIWKRLFSTVVFIISGHIPNSDDVRNIMTSFQGLRSNLIKRDSDIKKVIDTPEFVFGSLPYLFCGFIIQDFNNNSDGRNPVDSAVEIYLKLILEKTESLFTVLCAHRESKKSDRGSLVDTLDYKSIDKMVNLVAGIILNIPEHGKRVYKWKILQPGGRPESVLSLFPNVILRYVNTGKLGGLLSTLDRHVSDLKDYLHLVSEVIGNLTFEVETTDILHKKIPKEISVQLKGNEDQSELTILGHKIEYISRNDTFKDMIRIVSNFENLKMLRDEIKNQNISNARDNKNDVMETLQLINTQSDLFIKSMFETWFYYYIGILAQKENSVILGFERDHDLFQAKAINLSYNQDINLNHYKFSCPLLYARRYRPEEDFGSMNTLSFRQFWRVSDKIE